MKLRRLPEDFLVEELADVAASGGDFALYRLTKQSLGTPEAVAAVLQRWNLPRAQVSYGGLKDRHAVTTQHVTIFHGPRRNLTQESLRLEYLGQVAEPFTSRDIRGNRFSIVLRSLTEEVAARVRAAADAVRRDGVPNYFDDQRFGSRGESGEFIARAWCLGNYERALWLALADANAHDRPEDSRQKELLRKHWGQWAACQAVLAPSPRRDIVQYLADRPRDVRGALARIQVDLRGLYLAAFQSALWNRMLAALLRTTCRAAELIDVAVGDQPLPFFHGLSDSQRAALGAANLPLPSSRVRHEEGPLAEIMRQVVAAEGLEPRQLRVKYPRDSFFAKGHRAALVAPCDLTSTTEKDEVYADRSKLRLSFDLPRGCYATIVIKRLMLGGRSADE